MDTITVGRIVHYKPSDDGAPEAALVIEVYSDTSVSLAVCNSGGTWRTERSVELGAGAKQWSWHPRV